MTQDNLDNLLKQWATTHATTEEHTRELADRIVDELATNGTPVLDPAVDRRVLAPQRRKLAYASVGIAAALLIVATVCVWSNWPSVPEEVVSHDEDTSSPIGPIGQSELQASARLFHEMETLFADDLRWVADSNNEVRLGIRPVSGGPIACATPLLIRVLVIHRNRGETSWHELMRADVLTRSQELVEAVPDTKLDNRLLLWAYVVPDGKVVIDLRIRLTEPIRAYVDVTNVLSPGKPAKVFSLETEDAEYQVFQVVKPLPKHEGVSCSEI